MKKQRSTEIFPISLLALYVVLSTLTDYDWYYEIFYNIILKVDTVVFILSIYAALHHISEWTILGKSSLITVLALNILTEMSFRIDIPNYYNIYNALIVLFFVIQIAFFNPNKSNRNDRALV